MDKLHRYAKPFADPDRRYAVYQIIHGGAADPALAKHYDALGFGGIVGNIPYTRAFPHDETLWQKTAEGMRAYIERGMHTWIYDENGYPHVCLDEAMKRRLEIKLIHAIVTTK